MTTVLSPSPVDTPPTRTRRAGSGVLDPKLLLTSLPAVVLTTIVGGIGQVAQVSALVLVYLDRRMRRDGLDLELRRFVEQGGRDPFEPLG